MQNTLKIQRIYRENLIWLILELNKLEEQNEQANRSYITNQLMPKRKNKLNTIFFLMLFDEIQDTIMFHQRFPNMRLMDQIHDKLSHQHTNDIYHYSLQLIYSSSVSFLFHQKQNTIIYSHKVFYLFFLLLLSSHLIEMSNTIFFIPLLMTTVPFLLLLFFCS